MIVADKSEDDVYQLWLYVDEAGSVIITVSSATLSESDYCRHNVNYRSRITLPFSRLIPIRRNSLRPLKRITRAASSAQAG